MVSKLDLIEAIACGVGGGSVGGVVGALSKDGATGIAVGVLMGICILLPLVAVEEKVGVIDG